MPANDLDLLIAAAHAAGQVATSFVGGELDVRHKDDGAGPVTAADLAANAVLEQTLRGARPGYGWLSEESPDDPARLNTEHVFIVDPLDGTRSFISGENTWAHSIALAENGRIVAAAIYLPMLNRLYTAAEGSGAHLNGTPIQASDASNPDTARVLAARPALDPQHWPGGVPDLRRSHRPSLAYRLSLVAEGRYDAMFTFRPSWEWDIAAGTLILQEAGAVATDKTGGPLIFNNPHPQCNGVLAAAPALHAALLQRLR
ncbi:3'(2'),5'-bisphosphate nucleotidase CysQ [Mesobacterium sp. TK19101]|uniref:3'(2'),5'-bisphosphate nucleotidase CysQ n=1 Tax=Mesobacterium hydrothermale TaxID=3111907 RepID=A0ABU6HFW9_9RHOB|nr:3'(2'),5'-bisphosphate nucleotidase CysQ [Mesobacterium sp. TK19101]MEC3860871.1 3'(2'),5'-bisphosphate nucleotidase CysQ [Mesobacterium sp. TK19101]